MMMRKGDSSSSSSATRMMLRVSTFMVLLFLNGAAMVTSLPSLPNWLSATVARGSNSVHDTTTTRSSSSSAAWGIGRRFRNHHHVLNRWITPQSSTSSSNTCSDAVTTSAALLTRGGGLFGGGKNDTKSESSSSSSTKSDDDGKTMYPAMSQTEIEEWLEHIPVFAVTDANGAGVILQPANDTSVFFFFFSPLQANATLQHLKSGAMAGNSDLSEMDLKISAFSLGKIWFSLLQNSSATNPDMIRPNAAAEDATAAPSSSVEYRLVPDVRDLLGARMLLTMKPEDGEKVKEAGGMTPEMAEDAIRRAMEESPKFTKNHGEIPVFTIAQMRMVRTAAATDASSKPSAPILPMYLSLQNLVGTWQQFISSQQDDPELKNMEPAINLMSLDDIVSMMQKESEIDWRNVVLVPPAPPTVGSGSGSGSSATSAAAAGLGGGDPMAGATLGDD